MTQEIHLNPFQSAAVYLRNDFSTYSVAIVKRLSEVSAYFQVKNGKSWRKVALVSPIPLDKIPKERFADVVQFFSFRMHNGKCCLFPCLRGGGQGFSCCREEDTEQKASKEPLLGPARKEKPSLRSADFENDRKVDDEDRPGPILSPLTDLGRQFFYETTQKWWQEATKDIAYIPPMSRAGGTLENLFLDFLDSRERVFLLLAEGGMGKTLFFRRLEQKLWEQWEERRTFPLFISLAALRNPKERAVEETLERKGFSLEEIARLKASQSFVFFLDGYDELMDFSNLDVSNKLGEWKAKVAISCRSQHVERRYSYIPLFAPIQQGMLRPYLLRQCYMSPFTQEQIDTCLQNSPAVEQSPWSLLQYRQMLASIPDLRRLAEKPFLLLLIMKALPALAEPALSSENRWTLRRLLEAYVDVWFVRQAEKTQDYPQEYLLSIFKDFARSLALEMEKRQICQIPYREAPWDVFFSNQDREILLARSACPIQEIEKGYYAFYHLELQKYFVALSPQERGLPLHTKDEAEEKDPEDSIFQLRSFVTDRSLVSFYAEKHEEERTFPLLLERVKRSKGSSNLGVITAATNSITVLNAAGYSFSGENLEGIQVPGANLENGIFFRANLRRANLRGVSFSRGCLDEADLTDAVVENIELGAFPYRHRHETSISNAVLSENGKSLFTASFDKTIYWNLAEGVAKGSFAGSVAPIVSPDGSIALVIEQTTILGLDVETKEQLFSVENGGPAVPCFSPGSEFFYIQGKPHASKKTQIYRLEAKTGKRANTFILNEFEGDIKSFHTWNEQEIVAVGENTPSYSYRLSFTTNTVHLLGRFLSIKTFISAKTGIGAFISSPSVRTVVIVKLGPLQGAHHLQHLKDVQEIVFSPDGFFLISKDVDNTVYLWSIADGSLLGEFPGVSSVLHPSLLINGGQALALAHYDHSVVVWDWSKKQKMQAFTGLIKPVSFLFSANEGKLLIFADGNILKRYPIDLLRSSNSSSMHHKPLTAAVQPTKNISLISAGEDGSIKVWDKASGRCLATLGCEGAEIQALASTADGKKVFSWAKERKTDTWVGNEQLRVWDMEERLCQRVFPIPGSVMQLFLPSDETALFVLTMDAVVQIWDWKNGAKKQEITLAGSFVSASHFSHESEILAAATYQGETFLFSARSLLLLPPLKTGWVDVMAGSEELLICGSEDYIQCWNIQSRELLYTLLHTGCELSQMAYCPKRQMLALGDKSGEIAVWGLQDRKLLTSFRAHRSTVKWLSFAPEGTLFSSGEDVRLCCWQLPSKENKETLLLKWHASAEVSANCTRIGQTRELSPDSHAVLLEKGATLLEVETEEGFLKKISELPDESLQLPQDSEGNTFVHIAAQLCFIQALETLQARGVDMDAKNLEGQNALLRAILGIGSQAQRTATVHFLLKSGVDKDLQDEDGATPLIYSLRTDSLQCVKLLIAAKANVNLADSSGKTPVFWAVNRNSLGCLRLLAGAGADLDAAEAIQGATPAHLAVGLGRIACLQFLAERKVNFDILVGGTACIHKAVQQRRWECLQILANGGADLNKASNEGLTPAMFAADNGSLQFLQFLAQKGVVNFSQQGHLGVTAVFLAVAGGHIDCLQFLIAHNASLNIAAENGYTPIMWAVHSGFLECLTMLADQGVDLHQINQKNDLDLVMIASSEGQGECLSFLADRKVPLDRKLPSGSTALHLAASRGYLNCLQVFASQQVDLHPEGAGQTLPVGQAVLGGNLDCVKFFFAHGADLEHTDILGDTYVHKAVMNNHPDCLQFLLSMKPSLNRKNAKGFTPAHLAAIEGRVACLHFLIEANADFTIEDMNGFTPLMCAAYTGQTEALEFLMEQRIPEALKNKDRVTAVHAAALSGQLACLKILANGNVPLNATDRYGLTPVHMAAGENRLDCLIFLASKNLSLNQQSFNGDTPADLAKKAGHQECLQFFASKHIQPRTRKEKLFPPPNVFQGLFELPSNFSP